MDSDTMTRRPPKEWRQSRTARGTDKTGMNFRRSLPEFRCQSCLSPVSQDWHEFSAQFAGISLPVLSVPGLPQPLKGTPRRRHSTCDTDRASGTFTSFRGPILQTLIHARNARSPSMNKTSKSFFFLAALSIIAAALILQSFDNAQASPGDRGAATYSGGTLRLTIPFRGLHPGSGQLTVEVLDPEDGVLGRAQRRVDVAEGAGSWREEIALDRAPSLDDMVWQRVRYRFTYSKSEE